MHVHGQDIGRTQIDSERKSAQEEDFAPLQHFGIFALNKKSVAMTKMMALICCIRLHHFERPKRSLFSDLVTPLSSSIAAK